MLHGVSEQPVLSGLTGHFPWNVIATHYFDGSRADTIPMRLSLLLSLQLRNSTKYDYYMISTKSYAWILTKREATSLYMIYVRFADQF